MRSKLSLAPPETRTFTEPGTRASRYPRGDVLAVAVLVALPVLVFGLPALAGHPVYPGDDLTQNFPLRVLAGRQIRGGQLPLSDPYIWSGAPLLGGWNAGAAYPLTLLFAVVPPVAAWTLNMIGTWAVAGLGMFVFLRALRLGSLPGLLGALSFAFAGAMSAQVAHFGLVAGMSWVPWQLLGVLRLTQARTIVSRLRWIAALGAAVGLTILAGEPRAIDDALVVIVIYAAWQIARLGRRCGPAAVSVAAGLALGTCLGAVQWMPGLAAVATSQRAASSAALFNSGSLPARWLLLMLVPDLLGGSGSFGQPSFFATYNLAEVTSYVGVLPLVGAAVLLGRLRLRPPAWIVWHIIAVVGVVLALGGHTPVGHLLVHLPLFGDQRLQSRNILVTDLALAVLLAYWAEQPLGQRAQRFLRARGWYRIDPETVLGVLPPLAVIAVVVAGLCWGTGLLRWLGTDLSVAAADDGRLRPWLVPYAVLGAGAIAFVLFGRRLRPRPRARWLAGFIVTDLVVFTLLGVVAVGAGPASAGQAPGGPGAAAARQVLSGAGTATRPPATRPVADLGYPGRFAIYDPNEVDARQLPLLGSPDLNAISATPSVQGYSSIVDGRYATATGSHQATGEGQDVLSPRAVGNGTLGQLDTSVLLTVPAYLITAAGASGPAAEPPAAGRRDLAGGQRTTWYFGTPLEVSTLELPDPEAARGAGRIRIGLLTAGGSARWFPARAAGASRLAVRLPRPVTGVAVIGQAGREPSRLGPPSVTGPDGAVFVADGQLQDALTPPQWTFAGQDGPFAVFADHLARGPLVLEALPGRSASGASVTPVSGPADEPAAAEVRSAHGVRLVRTVAAIPGWRATWNPRQGRPVALPVRRAGLVQAVDVPPGAGVVSWTYVPPGLRAGVAGSLAGVAVIPLLLLPGRRWLRRRTARPRRRARKFYR